MKSLKIAVITAVSVLLAVVLMAAEDEKPKEKSKEPKLSLVAQTLLRIDRIESAIKGLDLSDDQKEKLVKVRDEFEAKRHEIQDKIADLLTEEQKQIGKEALESAEQSGKKDRKFYQSLEASLKLTDEQKEKLEPFGKELQGLVNDSIKKAREILTPEQKEKLQEKIGSARKNRSN